MSPRPNSLASQVLALVAEHSGELRAEDVAGVPIYTPTNKRATMTETPRPRLAPRNAATTPTTHRRGAQAMSTTTTTFWSVTDGPAHSEMVWKAVRWLRTGAGMRYVLPEAAHPSGKTPDAIGMTQALAVPPATLVDVWAVECKRARVDLVGDLARGKMLHYEQGVTHCVLFVWHGVLDVPPRHRDRTSGVPMMLEDLRRLGLPDHWGVRVVWERANAEHPAATTIREPMRIRDLIAADVAEYAERLFAEVCAKVTSPRSGVTVCADGGE